MRSWEQEVKSDKNKMMLNARATFILFPPSIVINPNPKNLWDKVSGSAAGFVNDLIKAIAMNVTLVPTNQSGGCNSTTRSCTGMRGKLQSGEADFSLMQLQMEDLDPKFIPHQFGPQVYANYYSFGSYPIIESSSRNQGVFSMIFDIPITCIVIYLILTLMLSTLINFNLYSPDHKWKSRFTMRYDAMDILLHLLMHPRKNFNRLSRKIALAVLLFGSLWCWQNLMGNAKSDLTVTSAPKYLESLIQVEQSNRSLFIMKGLILEQHFSFSKDPIKQRIHQRLIRMSRKDVKVKRRLIADQMMRNVKAVNGIGFYESDYFASASAAYACRESNYDSHERFRISPPFMSQAMMIGMSYNITPDVRRQVTRRLQLFFETAVGGSAPSPMQVIDPSDSINYAKLIPCWEFVFSNKRHSDPLTVMPLPLRAFAASTYAIIAAVITILSVIAYEILGPRREQKQKKMMIKP